VEIGAEIPRATRPSIVMLKPLSPKSEDKAEIQAGQSNADFNAMPDRRKAFPAILQLRTVATENRLSKCRGRPLGLCGQRLPELNLIPIQVIDTGKATVGLIHSFGVNLYSLLF